MPTFTTNYGLSKPLVNNPTDQDVWGGELNGDMDELDGLLLSALNLIPSNQTSSFSVTAPTPASSNTGDSHKLFRCDATSGVLTASLPAASSAGGGFTVAFKKTDGGVNALTISAAGSDKIDGSASYSISSQYGWVVLVSDGLSNWDVISNAINLNGAVITLGNGSTATTQLGTDTSTKVANMASVQAAIIASTTSSFTTNGYRISSDGYIDQWGESSVPSGVNTTISLPTNFLVGPLNAQATIIGSNLGFAATVVSKTTTSITLNQTNSGNQTVSWRINGK